MQLFGKKCLVYFTVLILLFLIFKYLFGLTALAMEKRNGRTNSSGRSVPFEKMRTYMRKYEIN